MRRFLLSALAVTLLVVLTILLPVLLLAALPYLFIVGEHADALISFRNAYFTRQGWSEFLDALRNPAATFGIR